MSIWKTSHISGERFVRSAVVNGKLLGGTERAGSNILRVPIADMKQSHWNKTKRLWFKLHPANHEGYWICALCGRWTSNPDLDHILKRGAHPKEADKLDNLRAVCRSCHIKRHQVA